MTTENSETLKTGDIAEVYCYKLTGMPSVFFNPNRSFKKPKGDAPSINSIATHFSSMAMDLYKKHFVGLVQDVLYYTYNKQEFVLYDLLIQNRRYIVGSMYLTKLHKH